MDAMKCGVPCAVYFLVCGIIAVVVLGLKIGGKYVMQPVRYHAVAIAGASAW